MFIPLALHCSFQSKKGPLVRLYSTAAANNGLLSRFLTRFYFPERERVFPSSAEVYSGAIRSLRFLKQPRGGREG